MFSPTFRAASRGFDINYNLLDSGRAVPLAAAVYSVNSACTTAMDDIKSEESRSQEEDRSKEAEGNICFEFGALAFASDAVPVPDATTMHWANEVGKKSEGDHPGSKQEQVDRPMNEGCSERDQEQERDENAQSGNDLSVDETFLGPC